VRVSENESESESESESVGQRVCESVCARESESDLEQRHHPMRVLARRNELCLRPATVQGLGLRVWSLWFMV